VRDAGQGVGGATDGAFDHARMRLSGGRHGHDRRDRLAPEVEPLVEQPAAGT
jgi:hypothetical protein